MRNKILRHLRRIGHNKNIPHITEVEILPMEANSELQRNLQTSVN